MEVGKLIHFVEDKVNHRTISMKPFGCMPSSGVSDGVQGIVQSMYPDAIFLPIETTGDGRGPHEPKSRSTEGTDAPRRQGARLRRTPSAPQGGRRRQRGCSGDRMPGLGLVRALRSTCRAASR